MKTIMIGIMLYVSVIFIFFLSLIPSILFVVFGWKMLRKIQNQYLRIVIRFGLISIAFTPTIYGHAGLLPAFWVVFVGQGIDRILYGLMPILVVWILGVSAMLGIKLMVKSNGNNSPTHNV